MDRHRQDDADREIHAADREARTERMHARDDADVRAGGERTLHDEDRRHGLRHDRDDVRDDVRGQSLRDEVVERERERFGGFKFGSAFFGWLAAMGTAVLLTALVAAIGVGVGWSTGGTVDDAADAAAGDPGAVTVLGAIALGIVLLVAYFAGGYVAGRMARFNGVKQGFAVWLWAIVIAVVVAVVTAIAGSQWDILSAFNGFPRIPVTPETATTAGILTAVGAAVVTLIGAILGGMAGMRYHRRVDRVGLGA